MKKNRRSTFSGSRKFLFALFALFLSLNATAQMVTVKGQVADTAGESIIGASIKENGTTNGTITNFDGNFELQVNEGALLTISYIGYTTIEVKATANMVVTLKEDTELLDEVVVIGYGSVKRKDVTTSISSVSTI